MDLHEAYEAAHRELVRALEVTTDVVLGADKRATHHCYCGYTTELIEVMAIHVVRAHNWPSASASRAWSIGATSRIIGWLPRDCFAKIAADSPDGYYEADDPSGPWTKCPDGIVRKRYAAFKPYGR